MGLGKNNNAVFLSIGDGKITMRVKQPTESSVQRTTKEGKIINEEVFDHLTGRITDIKVTTHDQYGKFWNITVDDGEKAYTLQTNYSGGYASAFLKALPNADLSRELTLIPYMKKEGDKKKVTLFISQDGAALKHFYTKDDPKGLPEMKQVKVKGQLQWDDTDMMEFLENMVNTEILPKIKKSEPVHAGDSEETDDVPF